jgi:hypothetical protein
MSKNTQEPTGTKSGVSVSDMARTVGLSRQRFHQLMKAGVFPEPLRDEATGRPYYDGPGQAQCVEVRRRNCGVNGKVVLFYARRQPGLAPAPPARLAKPRPASAEPHADVLDGVRALGLAQATAAQVAGVVTDLFPGGTVGLPVGEVIRAVFLRLRKDTADKVG